MIKRKPPPSLTALIVSIALLALMAACLVLGTMTDAAARGPIHALALASFAGFLAIEAHRGLTRGEPWLWAAIGVVAFTGLAAVKAL